MECPICGKSGKTVKVRIEGAVIDVCESCARFGSKLPSYQPIKKPVKLELDEELELVQGYGRLVKAARIKKGMTRIELAQKVGEKESVISRIEKEEMRPEDELVERLEQLLGVKLLERYAKKKVDSRERKAELTIGDVVEVR